MLTVEIKQGTNNRAVVAAWWRKLSEAEQYALMYNPNFDVRSFMLLTGIDPFSRWATAEEITNVYTMINGLTMASDKIELDKDVTYITAYIDCLESVGEITITLANYLKAKLEIQAEKITLRGYKV